MIKLGRRGLVLTNIVGVVGGIASGKSTVVEMLKEHGACAIHADPIVHKTLENPDVIEQLRAYWRVDKYGYAQKIGIPHWQVFRNDVPCRLGIGKLVFENPAERIFLEDVLHPYVNAKINELIEIYSNGYHRIIVLDIPLLIEYGWNKRCDEICFVDCSLEERILRYAIRTRQESSDAAREDYLNREKIQISVEKKKELATVVFENTTTKFLQDQVNSWIPTIIDKIRV